MSYSKVPLIVDVVMMCYTIRSAASGLVLPCTLVVSFPAGYMVFLLVAHCYYWSLVVTPGCMSVTAGSSRFVLALQTGDVKLIEKDETQPIPTMPNLSLIKSNSPTVSHYLKDCIVNIPYTNVKTFADDVLSNHVGDKELKLIDGVGIGRKPKIKKDDMGMPKEPNKERKLNDKVVPHNKNDYYYQWHPIEIPHLNRIIKES
ncbi:hypothetical protein Tco_0968762 [Tanacetum coccineum]